MRLSARMASDIITALLLASALLLGGILLARHVTESGVYRQSRIIGSIFSDSHASPGVSEVFTDARSRDVLMKFAGAVANGYVSFELIPVNEAETFAAVFESIGTVIEIERFYYDSRNLVIEGTSPDKNGYLEFLRRLRGKPRFESVTGHYYLATDGLIRFEIECAAAQ